MIAVDWGTSSLRAYRLSEDGGVMARTAAPLGISTVRDGAFADALDSQIDPWLKDGESLVLMSGMIGSRQGWVEAPYCDCPAGFAQIALQVQAVPWARARAFITPGVRGMDRSGVPDVMRGEEMQILGALDALPEESGLVCLPGTHSKWVRVRSGQITGFATHMTGEVFALLKQHSLLGRMMREGPTEFSAFRAGLQRSSQEEGLLHHLFGVRSQGLFGQLDESRSASYLSGLLIGHEFQSALSDAAPNRVYLLGATDLVRLYLSACEEFGIAAVVLDPESAVRGLHRLSRELS